MTNTKSIIISLCALVLLSVMFGKMLVLESSLVRLSHKQLGETERIENPFSSLDLDAKAVFVWDVKQGVSLYALNENVQLPLASLTKMVTVLVAAENGYKDDPVTISRDAILREGDHGFIVGERWNLEDIIDVTLLTSSNDGAYAIAETFSSRKPYPASAQKTASFIAYMNQKVKELGLSQTFFLNESGLDINPWVSGAYGSARDVARLMRYILINHPSLLETTTRTFLTKISLDGTVHNLENTNKFIETFPGAIASKTGFTDLAGGNVVVAFDAGPIRPIIAVVLGSTEEGRFTDVEQLIWASLSSIAR